MASAHILPFEPDDLTLIPMAGRRALDRAGLRLSLRAWQGLSLPVRHTLVSLGAQRDVDVAAVVELLADAEPPPDAIEPLSDPPEGHVPSEVAGALDPLRPLGDARWAGLSALERYALHNYARRGRGEKLALAYDALMSSGRSQSSR